MMGGGNMKIEPMADFFKARVEGYDEHMLNEVEGCREGYRKMAELVPVGAKHVLDLGCGTGLELDELFKINPDVAVTGIDLTAEMLNLLRQKHPEKRLRLINASYFDVELGTEVYEGAISFQSLHHFTHEQKSSLYGRVYDSLKAGGLYIEGDYMVKDQNEEDFYFSELKRIKQEQGIPEDKFYHYDTPCTIDNQIMLLNKAGFRNVKMVWRQENTTIIIGEK
jgi:cyclopropane fatty-acyl-phospholipid synthase-like methyltransferase